MCQWIAENLGPNIPLQFSEFQPDFKMLNKNSSPLTTLLRAKNIALSYGLNYVYCGNVFDTGSNSTYCSHCKKRLIERNWYQLGEYNLTHTGQCNNCVTRLHGHFAHNRQGFGRSRIPVRIS